MTVNNSDMRIPDEIFLWHTFGDHGDEIEAKIIHRKRREIEKSRTNTTFWTIGMQSKGRLVDRWRELLTQQAQGGHAYVVLGGKGNPGENVKPQVATHYTENVLKGDSGWINIPEFIVLYTEEQLKDHPNLADRAAKYLPDTNEVYINMLYEPMQLMNKLLTKEFASKSTNQEDLDEAVLAVLENIFKLKMGTAVVFALSKKNKEGWDYEEAEDSWSPETLSIVADFWQDDLPDARTQLNKMFKRLSA